MRRLICISLVSSALLAGCVGIGTSTGTKTMATVINPKPIATFTLNTTTPTVRDLLIRLRSRAPNAMQARGLDAPLFEDEADGQWANLSFKNPSWIYWSLGVQFLRKPDETGNRVEAWIRIVGGRNDTNPDPDKLESSVIELIRAALETAGAAGSN